jgi:hypothetical protein
MSERKGSRWTHFLLMLPFFLIGVAIPVYFYGFSGDGPPEIMKSERYEPAPAATPDSEDRSFRFSRPDSIVGATRDAFERTVDNWGGPGFSPLAIKFGFLALIVVVGFVVVRVLLHFFSSAMGTIGSFLIHKAAGPMFMGFIAVGSTWGIHRDVADEFGLSWAAATIAITAAIAALLALAGVRIRA